MSILSMLCIIGGGGGLIILYTSVKSALLNLNGLLVTRQIDNTSAGWGAPEEKLVPGSHKRCELGSHLI